MQHLVNYSAAPESDRFSLTTPAELSTIAMEIATTPPPASAPEFYLQAYQTDLNAVAHALRLQSEGFTILVARDEDGWYFARQDDRP